MSAFLSPIFGTGFFSSSPVHVALVVGAVVAVVSGVVGTFTVMRGQSFAGHSLADIGTAGGSAAFLGGFSVLYGFVAMNLIAAGAMGAIGGRRPRDRDLATGIVLGAALGLAALFLYWDTTSTTTTDATVTVLFGSIFAVDRTIVPVMVALGAVSLASVAILYRPLLLASLSPELASARGVRVSLVNICYLLALALAVSLSAMAIGAILSTALLIGPAATALRIVKRPGEAMLLSAALGVVATWLGILLAYDSYNWPPQGQGWPASFLIVAVVFAMYVLLPVAVRTARRVRGA